MARRHDFGVGDGAVGGGYQVDARGEQLARVSLENGGPERSPGALANVHPGEPDHKAHPVLDGRVNRSRSFRRTRPASPAGPTLEQGIARDTSCKKRIVNFTGPGIKASNGC